METFQILSTIQKSVKFFYFNIFVIVFSESNSFSNETILLSYFGRYIRKWSSSSKETFQIHSKIQKNVNYFYFNLFVTVFSESELVSNEPKLLSYFGRYIYSFKYILRYKKTSISFILTYLSQFSASPNRFYMKQDSSIISGDMYIEMKFLFKRNVSNSF